MTTNSLPVGWRRECIGDLAAVSRGASPRPIASPRWFDDTSDVGWVRIADLGRSDGLTLRSTTQRLSSDGISRSKLLPPGTLIMSIAATVGLPIITAIRACIHDGFVALERLKGVDQTYLLYVLKSLDGELRAAGQTGSQSNVNIDIVKRLTINVPPESEQRRIAEALRDTDHQIAALEGLIAKKEAIKQGMSQELLTGNTRLLSLTDPWREVRVDNVAVIDPDALTAQTLPDEVLDYISLEDVSRGQLRASTQIAFKDAPSRARRIVQENDVLFGTVRPSLQSHAVYTGGLQRPVASTGFAVVRAMPGQADPAFLFYVVMSDRTTRQIERIIAGSNYPAVSSSDVRRLTLSLPPVDEQRAIGAVLSDCDRELALLRSKLAKAKAIKQGMMQELLTGRTRLPNLETAAA